VFGNTTDFKLNSINLVKYLYDQSAHFAIKAGEVFVFKVENMVYNGIMSDALGIIKIEKPTKFLQAKLASKNYEINLDEGIIAKNVEKACLVFNYDYDQGFNVFTFEKNNTDAQYWNKDFLDIEKAADDFNATNVLLNSFKEFVNNDIEGLSKKEKISIYNKSMDQLADQEASLYIHDFVEQNLPNEEAQNKYLSYLDDYKIAHNINLEDTITVSKDAVNYQMQKNKNVIKLDKNFHIYVHGDESKIETGVDEFGRKFYKLYYEEEA
jgi:hypothetical protein